MDFLSDCQLLKEDPAPWSQSVTSVARWVEYIVESCAP